MGDILEILRLNPAIMEFTTVENGIAAGFMTKSVLNETLGGRCGYSLHARRGVRSFLEAPFLTANCNMPAAHAFLMEKKGVHPLCAERIGRNKNRGKAEDIDFNQQSPCFCRTIFLGGVRCTFGANISLLWGR